MNYAQLFRHYQKRLAALDEEEDALLYVFKELKDWSDLDIALNQNQAVSPEDAALLKDIYQKLSAHMPPQYITGRAYFGKLCLAVDKRVLIPRPETEELMALILSENDKHPLSVLDIGTGSGAIALSLKSARPAWRVMASDISPDALAVAKGNADFYQLALDFAESDVFSAISASFDIIVSNPPYIAESDRKEVAANVLLSEPHSALFAEEDGLALYRRIIHGAVSHLTEAGKLYLEIGWKQGEKVRALLTDAFPQKRVRILQDSFGKDRMAAVDDG
ncbi:peptide chain release factor N(5)-glutamine methyltransferase [Streptococcus sp. H49]|uniref:peptide chain release factor N(5)-glutamine methyltransferase n=1 Tax=Streptococcus huangxiaojuni TaxID=3237239 RepID=UPI0034A2F9F9